MRKGGFVLAMEGREDTLVTGRSSTVVQSPENTKLVLRKVRSTTSYPKPWG